MSTYEFYNLVSTNSGFLKSHALRITHNRDDAADLMQDTILKALIKKDHFKENKNIRAWLYTIMKNIFLNNRRKINYRRNALTPGLSKTIEHHSYNNGSYVYDIQRVRKDIEKINEKYSKPFAMFLEGFKYKEIQEAMNVPMGTVKYRIHIAKKKLLTEFKYGSLN